MGLSEALVRGIYAYGFERPSAVQQRAIVPILKGRDVIVQSQSGTGKTCVFCLGALQTLKIEKGERDPQVSNLLEMVFIIHMLRLSKTEIRCPGDHVVPNAGAGRAISKSLFGSWDTYECSSSLLYWW